MIQMRIIEDERFFWRWLLHRPNLTSANARDTIYKYRASDLRFPQSLYLFHKKFKTNTTERHSAANFYRALMLCYFVRTCAPFLLAQAFLMAATERWQCGHHIVVVRDRLGCYTQTERADDQWNIEGVTLNAEPGHLATNISWTDDMRLNHAKLLLALTNKGRGTITEVSARKWWRYQ